METGVMFRRSTRIGSRLIRWGTDEPWSHCGILIGDQVYHSDTKGCHATPYEEFCAKAETFTIPKELSEEQKARALKAVGYQYDWGAIAWFVLSVLFKKIRIILPRLTINPRWFVCSEYATYILWGKNETGTPGDVMNRVLDEQLKL